MRRRPEILAPAGDRDALCAALAAGADAVYFGLSDGFNARARANNFSLESLAETVRVVHRAGARAYVTLNTLVFEPELAFVERIVEEVARVGADAIIVQDPAVALIARAACPALEVHASTQMTVASADGARFAEALGVTRVVVPRELDLSELGALARETSLELEVFVHGALCVSWSGQCLTSEAWGGRSANRGQCAQDCRMPYDLVVDGARRDLGDVRYLLSPKDLAGVAALPELTRLGVHGLKIEGRQKGPLYVATATRAYARWATGEVAADDVAAELSQLETAYTRGFSSGFFGGSDHQTLVEGRFPKHRGALLGRVADVRGDEVLVKDDPDGRPWTGALALDERPPAPDGATKVRLPMLRARPATARPGVGVVFDAGHPEDPDEPGGPVFSVREDARGVWLGFGRPGPELSRVAPGQRVWLTREPSVQREVDALIARGPAPRIALTVAASGAEGAPLSLRAEAAGYVAEARSKAPLSRATAGGLDEARLRDKLGGLGGTPFVLRSVSLDGLPPGLFVPPSELKSLRRELVAALLDALDAGPRREVAARAVARSRAALPELAALEAAPSLVPLCRTDAQLEGALDAGVTEVELDWMEHVGLSRAVARAREAGVVVSVATLRVGKPGDEPLDEHLLKLSPDRVLVRHWGALMRLRERGPELIGDFSLNVTNSLTARLLLSHGFAQVTAAFDLDEAQLLALLDAAPRGRVAVVVHHHVPTFHTEHCVYAHLLSAGRDHRSCGRPCEHHALALRDHGGRDHAVIVDVACRNTVFDATPQSSAHLLPRLLERGVRRLRVELVRETREEARRLLEAYQRALAGGDTDGLAASLGARRHVGAGASPMTLLG